MIKKLKIENFQSHEDTELNLHPGVNVFTGNSDCGKSAIMRALIWAITNNPTGDFSISNWAKDSKGKIKGRCAVTVDDIKRVRSKEDNCYMLDGSKFEALRGDVPEQISKKLNIGDVNIQRQLDGPFMLSNSPGENAKMVNEMVNLTSIDEATSWINSESRECSSKDKYLKSTIESLQKKLKDDYRIEKVIKLIESVDSIADEIDRKESKRDDVRRCIESLGTIKMYDTKKLEELSHRCEDIKNRLDSMINTYRELKTLVNDYGDAKLKRCTVDADLIIRNLSRKRKMFDEISNEKVELDSLIKEWERLQPSYNTIKSTIANLTDQLSTMACPLCGRIGKCNH